MGALQARRQERASEQVPSGGSSGVVPPLSSNQDALQTAGLRSGPAPAGEDWTTELGAPTVNSGEWSLVVEDRNGMISRGVDSPVHVGDTLLLTCDLGAGRSNEPLHVLGGNPCFALVGRTTRGTSLTVEFEAVAVGRMPFFVSAWRGTPESQPHRRFQAELSVQMDATLFCQRNLLATQLATTKYVALQALAGRIGAAWEMAWTAHTQTLEAADEQRQLMVDLLFGAFVVGLSAGAGTAAAEAFRAIGATAYLVDGVKDLAKYGVKSALPTPKVGGLEPVPMDPLMFRAGLESRVGQEMVGVLEMLSRWTDAATSNDPSFRLDFDPAEAVVQHLTLAGMAVDEQAETLCTELGEARDCFECGFWAAWIEAFGASVQVRFSGPDLLHERFYVQSNLSWPIYQRVRELLPTGANAFLAEHEGAAVRRAQEEADQLNAGSRW